MVYQYKNAYPPGYYTYHTFIFSFLLIRSTKFALNIALYLGMIFNVTYINRIPYSLGGTDSLIQGSAFILIPHSSKILDLPLAQKYNSLTTVTRLAKNLQPTVHMYTVLKYIYTISLVVLLTGVLVN